MGKVAQAAAVFIWALNVHGAIGSSPGSLRRPQGLHQHIGSVAPTVSKHLPQPWPCSLPCQCPSLTCVQGRRGSYWAFTLVSFYSWPCFWLHIQKPRLLAPSTGLMITSFLCTPCCVNDAPSILWAPRGHRNVIFTSVCLALELRNTKNIHLTVLKTQGPTGEARKKGDIFFSWGFSPLPLISGIFPCSFLNILAPRELQICHFMYNRLCSSNFKFTENTSRNYIHAPQYTPTQPHTRMHAHIHTSFPCCYHLTLGWYTFQFIYFIFKPFY
jgi:hypothetical protein